MLQKFMNISELFCKLIVKKAKKTVKLNHLDQKFFFLILFEKMFF